MCIAIFIYLVNIFLPFILFCLFFITPLRDKKDKKSQKEEEKKTLLKQESRELTELLSPRELISSKPAWAEFRCPGSKFPRIMKYVHNLLAIGLPIPLKLYYAGPGYHTPYNHLQYQTPPPSFVVLLHLLLRLSFQNAQEGIRSSWWMKVFVHDQRD